MRVSSLTAVDRSLADYLRAEEAGEVASLALDRFQHDWDAESPSAAMRAATADLTERCEERFPSARSMRSVSRLCELLGVKLKAVPPRRKTVPVDVPNTQLVGHSGMVHFTANKAIIEIPATVDRTRARVATAHEIGHVLIHRRRDGVFDDVTVRLPSSDHEEALAEYAARLLLLPRGVDGDPNLAAAAFHTAKQADVTIYAAACRVGDPDLRRPSVRGAILWDLNRKVPRDAAIADRLTPTWHLCPTEYIPIRKCKARKDSVIASTATLEGYGDAVAVETVDIGSLKGRFRVHAFSWGSLSRGTRLVLSVFESILDDRD